MASLSSLLGPLDRDSFTTPLLSKLIGESRLVQNNPPDLVPREDLVAHHILDVLLPLSTSTGGGPLVVSHVSYTAGRGNVIVEYPGTEPGRILSFVGCHMDVVTADSADWDFPAQFEDFGAILMLLVEYIARLRETTDPMALSAANLRSWGLEPRAIGGTRRRARAVAGDVMASQIGGFSHDSEHVLARMVSDFLENGSSGAESRYSSDSDSGKPDLSHLADRVLLIFYNFEMMGGSGTALVEHKDWPPPPGMEAFDAFFRRADLDRDDRISGAEAVAFFQGANLPKPFLAQVPFFSSIEKWIGWYLTISSQFSPLPNPNRRFQPAHLPSGAMSGSYGSGGSDRGGGGYDRDIGGDGGYNRDGGGGGGYSRDGGGGYDDNFQNRGGGDRRSRGGGRGGGREAD